jgi:hypothetical protein
MRIIFIGVLLFCLPGICNSSSQTNSFQCPNGIVSVGDTREEVADKCGKPNSKIYTEVSPLVGSDAYRERNTHTYETYWKYDPGPNGFVYRVEFRGGKVHRIENTEMYGSN